MPGISSSTAAMTSKPWHGSPTRDAVKSIGTLDVAVSGILVAMAAQTARCLHALGVCIKATTAILSRRAPRILPESLGGSRRGIADRDQYGLHPSGETRKLGT